MAWGEAAIGDQSFADVDMPIITGTVYVATTGGDDMRSLATASVSTTPWKTLGRVNNCALAPGATILLNAGDTFSQAFLPMGGGASGSRVTLSQYGTGSLPKIRAATQLPSAGWTTVRANVYSIAAPQPVTLPGSSLPGFPANAALCVFWDNGIMQPVASAAAVSNAGDCFWGGGVLTLRGYTSDNPNAGTHIYRVCATNIASPDPTYGGHVGIEMRYDHIKIDSIDVAWAGHACIGQGYNQTRYTLDHDVRNCVVATCKFAAVMVTCDNTTGGGFFYNNSIDQSGGGGFGIVGIDPNLGWIKNVSVSTNTITGSNFGIAVCGSTSNWSIAGNVLSFCATGIGAISDVGLGTQYKPTGIAITGNTQSGDSGIAIQIENNGQSFGTGCVFSGNTVTHMDYGIFLDGDTSGTSTSGFLVERNIISDANGDGMFFGSNATGVRIDDNLITGCGGQFAGSSAGLHIKRTASAIAVYNNTLDQNQVGLWVESSGTGSGSHVLANNTVTASVAQDFLIADATQIAQSSHNNAFGGGTPGYNGAYTGLAAWQAAGFEAGSLSVSPGFVGPIVTAPGTGVLATAAGYALSSASPLISAGVATSLTTDYFGTAFHSPPSIGFYSSVLVSVSASYPGAIAWSGLLTRSQPSLVAIAASRQAATSPALEILPRASRAADGPIAFSAPVAAAIPAPISPSATLPAATPMPGAYLGNVGRGAPLQTEWLRTTTGTASGRASVPTEWLTDTSAVAIQAIEAAGRPAGALSQSVEWGLATVAPSAVGNTPMPLDWQSGRTAAISAPIERLLARQQGGPALSSEWIAPARGALVALQNESASGLRGAPASSPIEYRASFSARAAMPASWRAGRSRAMDIPTAWEGHASVTQATSLSVDWMSAVAGSRARGAIETLSSSAALARFASESLSLLAGAGPELPTEIGAAPFIPPAIAPALRLGLYSFAMKGLHGRYMLGGVLARIQAQPATISVGEARVQGGVQSINRAAIAPRLSGPVSRGAFGAVNFASGGSSVGEANLQAAGVLIFPDMAAGASVVGPLISTGTLVLVPPIEFAGKALAGVAIARGSLDSLNVGAGGGVTLPAIAGATTLNIQPNRVSGASLAGTIIASGAGGQINLGTGSSLEGVVNLSGALTSVDTLSGALAIDVNGPVIGGGTALFDISSGGISLSTVGFADIGVGTATNPCSGASLLGAATLQATIVITTFNNLAATVLRVGTPIAGATLFTERLVITLPVAAQGVPIALSGTYVGGPPVALSSSFNGSTWTPLTGLTIGSGAWSGTAPALAAAGPATIQVRDDNHTGVSATSASFTVASSAPAAPTSLVASGAATASAPMHGFYAADPDENGNAPAGRVLTVGPGGGFQYSTVSAALAAALDGDTIQVQAGTYLDDTATIRNSLTLTALGGRVVMQATVPLVNQKGILIVGTSTLAPTVTINGFDFTGAATPSGGNAAGIRYQNGALTITNCYFHDNQDGILGDPQALGTIFIDHCEFNHNGSGDGLTHNIYIGAIQQFTLQNSYSHDAVNGHQVKSRALNNTITNNRIFDNTGNSSYSIDLPQGGNATITGNIIQQGVNGGNPKIIPYNEEVPKNPGITVSISGNTFVNDMTSQTPTVVWNLSTQGAVPALSNNKFWGVTSAQIAIGATTQVGNTFLATRPVLDTTTVAYSTNFSPVAAHSVIFETRRLAHTSATGDAPIYANVGVNPLHDWSTWVADMNYLALSWAADTNAAAMTPVVGVPLCLATDNGNPSPAYLAITAGSHDAVFTGLVNAWKSNGFTTIYARIGYGGNDGTQPWDVGTDLTQAGQWIAAFQHVVSLLRAVTGITVKIVWNPAIVGARPLSVDQIYPGDAYVDVIGLTVFSGVTQLDNYSWDANNGSFEPDFATFMSKPVNRAHYWNWPSGTQANPTGVAGDGSFGLGALVGYAQEHGKPICIPASGVGNINDPNDLNVPLMGVWDDGAFPANLATTLFGAGVPPCLFIDAWDLLTTRGDWTFSDPSYTGAKAKPNATAAWGSLFTTKTSVSDSIGLSWTAPIATVTGYNVQYKLSTAGTWSSATPPAGTTTSVTVSGLAGATNYDFRVSATNVSGTGPYVTITAQAVP